MTRNATNKVLQKAKKSKSDEFYTQLSDIEEELKHYSGHFKDKVVFCNCDDPQVSSFSNYFTSNFRELGLSKLISACYKGPVSQSVSQSVSHQVPKKTEHSIHIQVEIVRKLNRV